MHTQIVDFLHRQTDVREFPFWMKTGGKKKFMNLDVAYTSRHLDYFNRENGTKVQLYVMNLTILWGFLMMGITVSTL